MKKFLVGLVIALVILVAGAEFGARAYISHQLKSNSGEEASISFGTSPVLGAFITHNVGTVEMKTPSTVAINYPNGQDNPPTVQGNPEAQIHIKNLSLNNPDAPIAGSMVINAKLTDEYMLAQVQASLAEQIQNTNNGASNGGLGLMLQSLIRVTKITSNAGTHTVDVEFSGGGAKISLHPESKDGKLKFTAENASFFGFDLPANISDAITTALQENATKVSSELQVDQVVVQDNGVDLQLSGTNVDFSKIEHSTTSTTTKSV